MRGATSHCAHPIAPPSSISLRLLLQNWYYTLHRFGRVKRVVVAAYDDESLFECLNLGFACYNGTSLVGGKLLSSDLAHGNQEYNKLVWTKPAFIQQLLIRNYTVLFSDLDTVWWVVHLP